MTTEITTRAVAQIYVKADGTAVPDSMLDDLVEAVVESSAHLPDMATLRFLDADFRWSDTRALDIGTELRIELGAQELRREVFVGEVTTIELSNDASGVAYVLVRGYDRAHRLHRGRKTRVFRQMSDGDIVAQIAREVGFTTEIDATTPAHEYVLQANQTDMEFLRQRASRNGYELLVTDRTLVFKAPPSTPAERIELRHGDNLLSFSVQLNASEQVQEVEVRGWDPLAKREIIGQASRAQTTTQVRESSSGADVAQRSFNDHSRAVIAREHIENQAQADAIAQAALDDLEQAFITAEGEAIGDPRLRLGSEVDIQNAGERFSGSYFVTAVTHRYGQGGYRNEFFVSGSRATDVYSILQAPAGPSVQLMTGVVTNNADDHDRGRVKVRLPALGPDVESNWCRTVAPGAGDSRGVQFLPEVDDEVLLIGNDVNQLFVLGGLWNQDDRPPEVTSSVVSGGAVERRIIRSRSGHVIILDDSTGSPGITIEDSTGNNRIVLDTQSNSLTIEVAGDINITAGGSLNLKADGDVTVQGAGRLSMSTSGGSLSLEAGSDLSLRANATATLEGGARAEVKAPTVNIGP